MSIFDQNVSLCSLSVSSTKSFPNENDMYFSSELKLGLKKSFLNNVYSNINTNKIVYKCPSIKSFQLPINDFTITDILKRHELTLPEINKQKIVYDPLLIHHLDKELPEYQKESRNSPMQCGKSLYSEVKWRKRMMNIKKRKKYQQKMFYVFQNRKQVKEKRYNSLCDLFKSIHEKKTEIFTPINYIYRELEKAKFYGYSCTNVYKDYRKIVEDNLKAFDPKYTRKFEDPNIPVKIV